MAIWTLGLKHKQPGQSPKGQDKSHSSILCPSTPGRAWPSPSHQTHKWLVLVTPLVRHFQKEKTSCPRGWNVWSGEGSAVAIEEQQPLNTPEGSSCCLDAFLSRKKAERRGAEFSQSFRPTAGNSPPGVLCCAHCTIIASAEEITALDEGQGIPTPNQDGCEPGKASFLHLVMWKVFNKAWGEWIHGKILMEVKGVWKTRTFPVKQEFLQKNTLTLYIHTQTQILQNISFAVAKANVSAKICFNTTHLLPRSNFNRQFSASPVQQIML